MAGCLYVSWLYISIALSIILISIHFLRLLFPMTHLTPSMIQLEQVTSPSAVTWYPCVTSQRTLRARQVAQALVALLFAGLLLPLASRVALVLERFLDAGGGLVEEPPLWEGASVAMREKARTAHVAGVVVDVGGEYRV
jgi:hypothetical protein